MSEDQIRAAFDKLFGDMYLSNSDTAYTVFKYGWESAQDALLNPAVPPPAEVETEAEKQVYAFGWFQAMGFMRRGK